MPKSAFGRAAVKPAGSAAAPASPIIVAADVIDPVTGMKLYTRQQVVDAMHQLIEGKILESKAKALISTAEPLIRNVARRAYVKLWADAGNRPKKSPKLVENPNGVGSWITTVVTDAERILDDGTFAKLAEAIGKENAQSVTIRREEFSLNPAKLEVEVPNVKIEATDDDGEPLKDAAGKVIMRNATVMDFVDQAITEKFAAYPDLLDGLFTKKPVFKTSKGMIDRLLGFVGMGNHNRLEEAMVAGRVTIQLRPGKVKADKAGDDDEDDDDE
jgi:hypothetical protein